MLVHPRRLKVRIEAACVAHGMTFPWWIPAYSTLASVALDVAAFVQRGAFAAQATAIAGAAIALVPVLTFLVSGRLFPPWFDALLVAAAASLLLTQPARPDLAPFLLLISAGELAATSPFVVATAGAAVSFGILGVATGYGHLDNAPLYFIGVVLGADVGIAMRWQMRALSAERDRSQAAGERAVLAERHRVAREVHDVVGHALSINLLHVTAARHALQEYGDVADALESLTEAERMGRSAMTDLRKTVTVLGSPTGGTSPLPGLADIPALVGRARAAGIDIAADTTCPPVAVSDATALGVYRIAQESLANIAKHAPRSRVEVLLSADARSGELRLLTRNTLPDGPAGADTDGGTGLPGMAARADQMGARLRAGVRGPHWVVELAVPPEAATAREDVDVR